MTERLHPTQAQRRGGAATAAPAEVDSASSHALIAPAIAEKRSNEHEHGHY
jgi:hypothetical protein